MITSKKAHGYVSIVDSKGNAVETEGGRLKVAADLSVDSVTVTDISIRDGSDPGKKVAVHDDGSIYVRVTGNSVKDSFSGNQTVTKPFPTQMTGFAIVNDGDQDLSFSIGDISITVKPEESFDGNFDPFTSVTITADSEFRAIVRG